MTTIGPAFPAQIFVAQAEVRLVAHQTAKADPAIIKADERALVAAQQSSIAQPEAVPPIDIVA
ncbi:hypothetical protein [Rhodopseudomonas palustris]|uniref:hypothetical protein n=1 Tax=Rhodopseudomonas palustris TaxID=1076 RepID=UPI0005A2D925